MAILEMNDVGVHVIEMKQRKRHTNMPTVLGNKVKEKTWPIRHLDFSLDGGEIVFVIDTNTHKPSIFLRLCCGLIGVDEGSAKLPERSVLATSPKPRLIKALSVGQSIRLLAGVQGLSDKAIDRRFDSIAEFAEVEKRLHRRTDQVPRQVMAQVAFAVSTAAPADLYTFDDNAFVGQREFVDKCGARIRELAAHGSALLISTGNASIIRNYGDRGLVLAGSESRTVSAEELAQIAVEEKVRHSGKKKRGRRRDQSPEEE